MLKETRMRYSDGFSGTYNEVERYLLFLGVPLVYAIIMSSGVVGIGVDVLYSYHLAQGWNWREWGFSEIFGWWVSTLRFRLGGYNYYGGVFITSFVLSWGMVKLLSVMLPGKYDKWVIYVVVPALLFSHVMIFSSVNILRQGLATAFLFYIIYCVVAEKRSLVLPSALLAIFSHNSVIIFIVPLLIFFYVGNKRYGNALSMLWLFVLAGISYSGIEIKSSISTANDYRPFYLLLVIVYAYAFITRYSGQQYNVVSHDLRYAYRKTLLFMILSVAPFFGQDSVLQRLIMMIVIPVLFELFGMLPFEKKIRYAVVLVLSYLWAFYSLGSSSVRNMMGA